MKDALTILTELVRLKRERYPNDLDGPDHGKLHEVRGVWDNVQTPCEWCRAWIEAQEEVDKAKGKTDGN